MTVVFTVKENERSKLAYILDSDLTEEEKNEQLLFLLHELVYTLPDSTRLKLL